MTQVAKRMTSIKSHLCRSLIKIYEAQSDVKNHPKTINQRTISQKNIISKNDSPHPNRRSQQRCSVKKGVLKNFTKKSLRPATLLKKRPWHRCFPVNFVKFLRTPFLQNIFGRLLLPQDGIQQKRKTLLFEDNCICQIRLQPTPSF